MATPVIMPRQGQSVETCLLGQWYKEVGEGVSAGDLLFSYETDKASFDEEAKADGFLLARYFEAGDEVPVLCEVAVIGSEGELIPEHSGEVAVDAPESEEPPRIIEFPLEPGEATPGRIHISPLARNMASQLGVVISGLQGSGPHGRIIARDVEAAGKLLESNGGNQTDVTGSDDRPVTSTVVRGFAPQEPDGAAIPPAISPATKTGYVASTPSATKVPQAPFTPGASGTEAGVTIKPLTNMRRLIAKAMHASLQNSAQLTHHLSADARNLLSARKKFKAAAETGTMRENVTINDLVCFAVIKALKQFPQVNTHFMGDHVKYFSKVHLGLAVDTDRGLMVGALQNADDLSVTGLSSRLQQLAADCRKGSINPDLLSPEAATFTVSNLGNYGVEMFTPVINLPQTAILGVCAIIPRPKELGDGVFAFVPHIGLSLTYDHRALDGGEATRFLAEIRSQLESLTF